MQHDAQIRRMQPVQADARNEMQALREEVRELRGLVADLKKVGGAGVIVDKLNRHDAALRQVETSMAMNFDLGDPIQPGTAAAPAAAADTAQAAPDFSYGGLAGTAAAPAAAAAAAPAATPSGSTWGQETPRPKQPAAQKDMRLALFEAGENAFKARKYNDAQRSFSDYLQNFGKSGDDKTTAAAQFYLGECYFQKNQFPDAALAYDTVITKYPKSAKAPGAYLKQGICFSKMKQKAAAKGRMNDLIKKFPNSPEAARARDFLKNNK